MYDIALEATNKMVIVIAFNLETGFMGIFFDLCLAK